MKIDLLPITCPIKEIKNKRDVHAFFKWCIVDEKINFHPDTSFENYNYTAGEALQLNRLLDQAFHIAKVHNFDIYQLAMNLT